ncbi:Rnf-Nqr domain containing protein [Salinispira pacifica]|uniref:Electron transport complex protein RnfE n=1 Tax=Salinispira pacifica TaxID=1307761 RepID=V5WEK4_9SPIO|nr:Rnf-Nqr domain containing protein [Salinispira pacifica]AHC14243.1 hypothetical protein L21SP2_0821 [Salinispira pacifica]
MKRFFNNMYQTNTLLFTVAGIGPVLLLSTRLIYSLSISAVLLIYTSLLILMNLIIQNLFDERLWYSARILSAAVWISIIDILVGSFFPLLRSDLGILLPMILVLNQSLLFLLPGELKLPGGVSIPGDRRDPPALFAGLFGYILLLNFIALLRELISFGSVNLRLRPWDPQLLQTPGPFMLFSTVFGALILLAYIRSAIESGREK